MNRTRIYAKSLFILTALLMPLVGNAEISNSAEKIISLTNFNPIGGTQPSVAKESMLLISSLLSDTSVVVVERDDLSKIMEERALSVSTETSGENRLGLQGVQTAKYLFGSSILIANSKTHFFCKLVDIESGTMSAFTVDGDYEEELSSVSQRVVETLLKRLERESHKPQLTTDTLYSRISTLDAKLMGKRKPTVAVDIKETHLRKVIIDPAAETEFSVFATEVGFPVIDKGPEFAEFVEVRVKGEGFTVTSYRQDNAIGVTARLEVKAVDTRTGRVVAIDRQTSMALGVDESIASKNALAKAAALIAERMLPKLVSRNNS